MKPLRIGIIGLGAIGSCLARIIKKEFSREAQVAFLCDLKEERACKAQKADAPRAKIVDYQVLIQRSDLILEAASQEIAQVVAVESLRQNKQVLILSVGGLLNWNGLSRTIKKTEGRLWIPSGALAGIDGILSANEGKIRRVTLTTLKPPRGLEGAPFLEKNKIRLSRIKKETVIFKGTAAEAIRAFPKNVNVAATLSLAGIGPHKTQVRIVTSPAFHQNQHEVEVEGDFGTIRTQVKNFPSKTNPRTSELAILSTVATLKKIFSRVRIGT